MNRRSTFLAFFASAFACICRTAQSDDFSVKLSNNFSTKLNTVTQLQQVLQFPQGFMFAEHVVDRVDAHSFISVQSTANEENGKPSLIEVRCGTMRIFRAHDARSADGEYGEIRWTIGSETKKTKIKVPNAVILVVRSLDGDTVNWYSLTYELRC